MSPYSLDLRKRVLDAIDQGQMTKWAVSLFFKVSPSWIRKLLQQRREEGTIGPKPHNGGRTRKLNEEVRHHLGRLVKEQPDATLAELAERLKRDRAVEVSKPTVCRALQELGLPLKKSRSMPARSPGRMFRKSVPSTKRR